MGKVGEKDIMQICNQFRKLDPHNSGKITLPDLLESHIWYHIQNDDDIDIFYNSRNGLPVTNPVQWEEGNIQVLAEGRKERR